MSSDLVADPGLLDLFRSELAAHTQTLSAGVQILDEDPAAAPLDDLLRAVHSIKGAGQIVRVKAAVTLATRLEQVFEALRAGTAIPGDVDLEALRRCTTLLATIGEKARMETLDELIAAAAEVDDVLSGLELATPSDPTAGAGPATPVRGKLLATLSPAPIPGARASIPGPRASLPGMPVSRLLSVEEPTLVSIVGSMLDLFQGEVDLHAQNLNNGLLDLEWNPTDSERLDGLMRASHSIKGAARIVKVEPAVSLAHAMEDLFVAAKEGQLTISSAVIDLLLRCTDTLTNLGRAAPSGVKDDVAVAAAPVPELLSAINEARQGTYTATLDQPASAIPAPGGLVSTLSPAPATEPPGGPSAAPASLSSAPASLVPSPPAALEPRPVEPARSAPRPDAEGETVRVSATNLSAMLELAGEALVRGRMLSAFGEAKQRLKQRLLAVTPALDQLQQHLEVADDDEGNRLLSAVKGELKRTRLELADQTADFNQFALEYERLAGKLHQETITSRMQPFSDITQGFRRMVRDITRQQGKQARLTVKGKQVKVDRDILTRIEAPITHLLRNALDHGLEAPQDRVAAGKAEQGQLGLEARHKAGLLQISVSDDGRGIDRERLRAKIVAEELIDAELADILTDEELYEFIFLPGFTTAEQLTEISGRGVGMDVVHRVIHEVGGSVRVLSKEGEGTQINLMLPVTLSVIRALTVEIADEVYACRLAQIDRCLKIPCDTVEHLQTEDQLRVLYGGKKLPLINATKVLNLQRPPREVDDLSVIVASVRNNSFGIIVDRFLGEQDLVVRPLDPRLKQIQSVNAVAIGEDGAPLLLLDVEDMITAIDADISGARSGMWRISELTQAAAADKARILVVDDSVTVREEERKILEGHGYAVEVAVDGLDGWGALSLGSYDLVITDVDMPRLNGVELVQRIRASEKLAKLPVIIVSYKDRAEDRQAGLEAGAQFYFTKSDFSDASILEAIRELLSEAES
jgi:two-component system, chemotaxis family, sensor histidine kinase and response regulator WspE